MKHAMKQDFKGLLHHQDSKEKRGQQLAVLHELNREL